MRKLKRILSVLLVCCMLLTLLPMQALAVVEAEEGGSFGLALLEDGMIAGMRVVSQADLVPASVAPLQGASPPAAIRDIFPDEVLAAEVARRLRTSTNVVVTQTDLDQIRWLVSEPTSVPGNVTSLEGLQYLRELAQLELWRTQVSDLSPLSGLVNLGILSLNQSQINDLSPLSGLVNLSRLYLNNNQISDLAPLSGLVNLGELWLHSNQISDLAPLTSLTNLTRLTLSNNQISDLSPLSGLNLWTLRLDHNQISDVGPLSELSYLGWLFLSHNQITDFSPIPELVPTSTVIGFPFWELQGRGQEIILEPIQQTNTVSMANMVRDQYGDMIPPNSVSDGGVYENGTITWSGLTTQQSISFSWERYISYGDWVWGGGGAWFDETSGTVTIPILPDPAIARTVIFRNDGIDTPVTVFPNWPIDWDQSPEAREIFDTRHEYATWAWWDINSWQGSLGRAFWGWFRSEELVYDRGTLTNRPALGTSGKDLSTLTFTESELEENITIAAVWSLWGDVNDDGRVDEFDVLHLNQWEHDRLLESFDSPIRFNPQLNLHAADVNVDGVVDARDVLMLRQWLHDQELAVWGPEPRFRVVLGRPILGILPLI